MSDWQIAGIVFCLAIVVVVIWAPSAFKAALNYVARDEMPIWLSITLAATAAIGAYFLAPIINEDFEFQKNRSEHVLSTVNDINSDIVSMSTDIRKFNDSLFYQTSDISRTRGSVLDSITKLQWRLIDMRVVINRSDVMDSSSVRLEKELEQLRIAVVEAKKPEDQELVIERFDVAAKTARRSLGDLYAAARLN